MTTTLDVEEMPDPMRVELAAVDGIGRAHCRSEDGLPLAVDGRERGAVEEEAGGGAAADEPRWETAHFL